MVMKRYMKMTMNFINSRLIHMLMVFVNVNGQLI